jgi:hypothetical protein
MSTVERIHKSDIATQLLEDAGAAYEKERYYSAINLAGAASELLCKLCELKGLSSPHQKLKKMLEEMYALDQDKYHDPKTALAGFNRVKNTVKHINIKNDKDEFLVSAPRFRAAEYINQAAEAATELDIMGEFEVKWQSDS